MMLNFNSSCGFTYNVLNGHLLGLKGVLVNHIIVISPV